MLVADVIADAWLSAQRKDERHYFTLQGVGSHAEPGEAKWRTFNRWFVRKHGRCNDGKGASSVIGRRPTGKNKGRQ